MYATSGTSQSSMSYRNGAQLKSAGLPSSQVESPTDAIGLQFPAQSSTEGSAEPGQLSIGQSPKSKKNSTQAKLGMMPVPRSLVPSSHVPSRMCSTATHSRLQSKTYPGKHVRVLNDSGTGTPQSP